MCLRLLFNHAYAYYMTCWFYFLGTLGPYKQPGTVKDQWTTLQENFKHLVHGHTDDLKDIVANINTPVGQIQHNLDLIWNRTEKAQKDIADMVETVDKISQYTWKLECQVNIKRNSKQYEHSHEASKITLNDVATYLRLQTQVTQDVKSKYQSKEYTLETVPTVLKFSNLLTAVQSKKVPICSLFEIALFLSNWESIHSKIIYLMILLQPDLCQTMGNQHDYDYR